MTRGRGALGGLVTAALASCALPAALPASHEVAPSAAVQAIAAKVFDRSHAELAVTLEVDNPGALLAVQSAEYEVFLDGRPFAVGVTGLRAQVPARDRARVELALSLSYLDLPPAARAKARRGEPIEVVARGALRAQGASIPFAGEAALVARAEGWQER
jgi:LEA14-like dessication related protein